MKALVATEAKSNRVVLGGVGRLATPYGGGQNRGDFLGALRGRQAGGTRQNGGHVGHSGRLMGRALLSEADDF